MCTLTTSSEMKEFPTEDSDVAADVEKWVQNWYDVPCLVRYRDGSGRRLYYIRNHRLVSLLLE